MEFSLIFITIDFMEENGNEYAVRGLESTP
jgi:hypothetical protein